ncbi:MAG: single-stranded-DNA-specific exonuclease RecJ, partial [Bacteroidetes bacterium]|nr:single-stranded-DNA-specific exonuclease RecJ [Bacteroidota bacterium]
VVAQRIPPHLLIPEIEIDAEINLSDIRQPFYNIINQFEPFGPTNLRPVFLTKQVFDYNDNCRVVKDTHLKFVVHQKNGYIVDGIGFGLADKYDIIRNGPFDMLYTIDENEFNGVTKLQVKVLDVRASA